ncbi:MAG: excisionase family DNA-binding protein [Gemmatimonadales bacterium]
MTVAADPTLPTPQEAGTAQAAVQALRALRIPRGKRTVTLHASQGGDEATVVVPRPAFDLLIELLGQLANGNAVTIVPVHAELTTQEAADLLNVSRPHLVSLLESRALPYRMVGTHRRVRFEDLMAFRQREAADRARILAELADEAQHHKLGYE